MDIMILVYTLGDVGEHYADCINSHENFGLGLHGSAGDIFKIPHLKRNLRT